MVVFRSRYTAPLNNQALSTQIGESTIMPAATSRNLGCTMDEALTMEAHIALTCRNAFYHLRILKRIRRYLTREATCTCLCDQPTGLLQFPPLWCSEATSAEVTAGSKRCRKSHLRNTDERKREKYSQGVSLAPCQRTG
eukprot:GHVO01039568.1.p1 GENE.GHVO01039568.1~~GHVO01039568.1.p1  ORF type:complete len:150 (-),score=3.23 GHVO01039568.1:588-1004(-)